MITALSLAATAARAMPARAERALAVDEALALARESNKDLRAARERVAGAEAAVEAARAALLPTLATQARYTRNDVEAKLEISPQTTTVFQPFNQLDLSAAINLPLIAPSAYSFHSAARAEAEAVEADTRATEASVLAATASTFYAAAGTDELLQARRNAVQVAQKTLDDAQAKVAAGVVNKVEVTRAEIAASRARQAVREAEDVRALAYRTLATLLQLREPFHLVVTPAAPAPAASSTSGGELARRAFDLRPEAQALDHGIEAARLQVRANGLRWLPTLSAFGVLRAFNYAGFYSQRNYVWSVGLQLDWLLYDGGSRDAARHRGGADLAERRLRLSALRDAISDEIETARRATLTRRSGLATAEQVALLARQSLDLIRAQHAVGAASQLDLLSAQDVLVNAEVSVAQSRFDVALADVALRRAAGIFP